MEDDMPKLKSIKIIGYTYHNGRRCSGFSHAYIEGEEHPRSYGEGECFDSIIADLTSQGIDCSDMIANLDHWVKTGE
jgi:hypothetical protein